MHTQTLKPWTHGHTFGQEKLKTGERRTLIVIIITGVMMVVEVGTGILFGSMALLADGLHMGSHTVALGINLFAYIYARNHAHDERFSFGTGKVNALGGYTGAVLLAFFAIGMAWESVNRLFNPVEIIFDSAIIVACTGLVVNTASFFILGGLQAGKGQDHGDHHHHKDHNLRSAYFHVLADALTSLTAIFALLAGKYFGASWMDPLMGIVGSLLVARWSWGLLRETTEVLLDRQADDSLQNRVKGAVEQHSDDRVADLHLWAVGPDIYSAELTIVSDSPRSPGFYKDKLPSNIGLVHSTVEVHRCVHH